MSTDAAPLDLEPAATPASLATAPTTATTETSERRERYGVATLAVLVAIVYLFSNPEPASGYAQTFIMAKQLFHGRLGVPDPRPWMELVPGIDEHYSVFPLGAVLTYTPIALLSVLGFYEENPAPSIGALQGAAILIWSYVLARAYRLPRARGVFLALFMAFGTWSWPNIAFGGAWHLALGFALIAQLAMIHFLRVRPSPFWAGFWFAVAFGNRTEVLVLTPLVLGLAATLGPWTSFPTVVRRLVLFCVVPAALAAATASYNYARFQSVFDMGYTRIPYVHEEAGFEHGLLSLHCIPMNSRTMLFAPWRSWDRFPYYIPNGFGESIVLCSPFILYLFARGAVHRWFKAVAWVSVALLTFALWIHANPGGWQYSYRYGMVFIPWIYILILESSPPRLSRAAAAVFFGAWAASIAISTWAVYAFYWGKHVG
jgi:hypothetical protein